MEKDNEEEEKTTSRGNEWEVVSLTASAYAAASGPKEVESIHEERHHVSEDEAEISRALFMSCHFAFPPSEHENLPLGPETIENHRQGKDNEDFSETYMEQENTSEQKEEESRDMKGLDPEEDMYCTGTYDENTVVSDLVESPEHVLDPSCGLSQSMKPWKDDENDSTELPSGAWWKRRVASLCGHAKETNTFWSVFIAAAVMGLVILGQRWQQERWQVLQQRWLLSLKDEKSRGMLWSISKLKDVVVGGSRYSSYIRSGPSTERSYLHREV